MYKKELLVLLMSTSLGVFLFWQNPWVLSDYKSDSYSWFLEFSRTIFQPQSAYYAESILLPLIAKIMGFTKELSSYKFLCAILTLAILPLSSLWALRYFQSALKAMAWILLFGLSFSYLRYFILGFPDPLTIILLIAAVFIRKPIVVWGVLVLAMLSHFSMAAIGVLALIGLVYFSPLTATMGRNTFIAIALTAVVTGKIILLIWYQLFHYQLISRFDWIVGKGYSFFYDRYAQDILAFWLTPGLVFLITYGLILAYFLLIRQYAFVICSLLALVLSYAALFWTVDGLRVFAVVICAPFAYSLVVFMEQFYKKNP